MISHINSKLCNVRRHVILTLQTSVVSPTSGKKNIVDIINGKRIRGYQSCVSTNVNRLANGYTPLQAADCPTILAKGMSGSSRELL